MSYRVIDNKILGLTNVSSDMKLVLAEIMNRHG